MGSKVPQLIDSLYKSGRNGSINVVIEGINFISLFSSWPVDLLYNGNYRGCKKYKLYIYMKEKHSWLLQLYKSFGEVNKVELLK